MRFCVKGYVIVIFRKRRGFVFRLLRVSGRSSGLCCVDVRFFLVSRDENYFENI